MSTHPSYHQLVFLAAMIKLPTAAINTSKPLPPTPRESRFPHRRVPTTTTTIGCRPMLPFGKREFNAFLSL
ncbi:hypothetical protein H4R19_000559 [Coemansia spiralis]|nr:hypothetical protein H4R19_000559 [Coemansia spiralis]